jgi:hypothetical protein
MASARTGSGEASGSTGLLLGLARSRFPGGGSDVICPSNASTAAADCGISRVANHRGGVYHVGGHTRCSCSAGTAAQRYYFSFDVADSRSETNAWGIVPRQSMSKERKGPA